MLERAFEAAFVLGGTGMLADATKYVARHARSLTVVSRNEQSTAKSLGLAKNSICVADWRKTDQFIRTASPRLSARPPDLALIWIHEDGLPTLSWLLEQFRRHSTFVVHVVGSTWSEGDSARRLLEDEGAGASERRVLVMLGSKLTARGSRRWLTHQEICAGTIEAIQTRRNVLVGDIIPVN